VRFLRIVGGVALLSVATLQPAAAQQVDKSKNVSPVAHVKYWGGTHLDFGGTFAFGGQWDGRGEREGVGGVRIHDLRGKPRQVGFFKCPGDDVDVKFVRPGLVAVGHHNAQCNPPDEDEATSGVYLLDVSNPKTPKMLGGVNLPGGGLTHSITVYPGEPIVYSNAGGLPSNGQLLTRIIDISNPRKPKVAAEFRPPPPPTGCHDFSFHFDKRGKFGFCAGLQGTQIWDVSDPLAPSVVTTIYNPFIQFSHYAEASPNGKILAINDENLTANDCVEQETPSGAMWFYDISDIESPQFLSFHSPRRGNTGSPFGSFWFGDGHCTSHDFGWVDNKALVVPWYTGGFSVLSVEDPGAPEEIAHYQPSDTDMWEAKYYRGRIYTSDVERGFEAFEVSGVTD
jgi:hypothetical protein